ncbi:MAG: hypothetical protein LIO90_01515 [Bacteroidales bacterium]|nr:hypothetical protein [Bacteroidales bacterium]
MHKAINHTISLLAVIALAGCEDKVDAPTGGDTLPENATEAYIVAHGGGPFDDITSSRAASTLPHLTGECKANKVFFFPFRTTDGTKATYSSIGLATAGAGNTTFTADLLHTTTGEAQGNISSVNKWGKSEYNLKTLVENNTDTWFSFPALAFTDADNSLITYSAVNSGTTAYVSSVNVKIKDATTESITYDKYNTASKSYSEATDSYKKITIPEMFFGRLTFYDDEVKKTFPDRYTYESYILEPGGYSNYSSIFHAKYNATTDWINGWETYLRGHLFRFVSQVNLNVTAIPKTTVSYLKKDGDKIVEDDTKDKLDFIPRIDLLATNVPKYTLLWGDHGAYVDAGTSVGGESLSPIDTKDKWCFYPITELTAADLTSHPEYFETEKTMIATINAADIPYSKDDSGATLTTGECTLSSFMLPSTAGSVLIMRVHYNMQDDDWENGGAPIRRYKDFVIAQDDNRVIVANTTDNVSKAQALSAHGVQFEDHLEVYSSRLYRDVTQYKWAKNAQGVTQIVTNKDGVVQTDTFNGLQIYNMDDMTYYFYSNIRIDITGKIYNIGTGVELEFTLEVEPSYEKNHTITL